MTSNLRQTLGQKSLQQRFEPIDAFKMTNCFSLETDVVRVFTRRKDTQCGMLTAPNQLGRSIVKLSALVAAYKR